jgi:hypothetical protein
MVDPLPYPSLGARRRRRYSRVFWARGLHWRDDIVFAWMIQYEWLLFFGLILVLAIVDLAATRRALRCSRKLDSREPESTSPQD